MIEPKLLPSSDLSYILGAITGDGCIGDYIDSDNHHHATIRLRVVSEPFANNFASKLKVIGLNPAISLQPDYSRYGNKQVYCVSAQSITFVNWYNGLSDMERFVTKCDNGVGFIRGFYDSEGCCQLRQYTNSVSAEVRIYNTKRYLLELIARLLKITNVNLSIYGPYQNQFGTDEYVGITTTFTDFALFFSVINPTIKNPYIDANDSDILLHLDRFIETAKIKFICNYCGYVWSAHTRNYKYHVKGKRLCPQCRINAGVLLDPSDEKGYEL